MNPMIAAIAKIENHEVYFFGSNGKKIKLCTFWKTIPWIIVIKKKLKISKLRIRLT